jgi:hypothetical protein
VQCWPSARHAQLHGRYHALIRDKAEDARERRYLIVLPQTQVLRANPAFGEHRRRLRHHQGRPAHRAAPQMHEVPIVGVPVDAGVFAHRRYANAIPKIYIANLQRRKQMSRLRDLLPHKTFVASGPRRSCELSQKSLPPVAGIGGRSRL